MCWGELDPERGLWTFPARGRRIAVSMTLPLPAIAWRILGEIPRRTEQVLLFGDRASRGFSGWHIGKRRLDARLGKAVASLGCARPRAGGATRWRTSGFCRTWSRPS